MHSDGHRGLTPPTQDAHQTLQKPHLPEPGHCCAVATDFRPATGCSLPHWGVVSASHDSPKHSGGHRRH